MSLDVVGLIPLEISSLKHSDWTLHQNVMSSSGSLKVCLPGGILMIISMTTEGDVWICKPSGANQVSLITRIITSSEVLGERNFLG